MSVKGPVHSIKTLGRALPSEECEETKMAALEVRSSCGDTITRMLESRSRAA